MLRAATLGRAQARALRPDRAAFDPEKTEARAHVPGFHSLHNATQSIHNGIDRAPQVGQVTFLNALVTLSLTGSAVSVATF